MANWKYSINIKNEWQKAKNGQMSIKELVKIIVPKFQKNPLNDDDLEDLLWELEQLDDTAQTSDFDEIWESIYDWADEKRVWIKTI